MAEADASAPLDFADWAVGNAKRAVLDALDARAYADDRAKIANAYPNPNAPLGSAPPSRASPLVCQVPRGVGPGARRTS